MRPSRSHSTGPRRRRFSDSGSDGSSSAGPRRRASIDARSPAGSKPPASKSRDSSTGSREVRCGCQYYQSDSLLPERISLVGTRPSSRAMGDHEYEPISPPQSRSVVPALSVTDIEGVTMQEPPAGPDSEPIMSDDSSGSPTRAMPVDVNVRVPYDGEEEVRTMGEDSDHDLDPELGRDETLGPDGDLAEADAEADDVLTAQQYQDQMEAQFFSMPSVASTPSTAPAGYAVESQTSAESQSQPAPAGSGLPQRLRSQAGKIKTKLRSISRPKLPTMPRPKRPNISFPKMGRKSRNANASADADADADASDSGTKESSEAKERHVSSTESNVGSSKNLFNFSTYPRVFSRKAKAGKPGKADKADRPTTPPVRLEVHRLTGTESSDSGPRRKSIGQRWVQKVKEIKFAEDDPEEKRRREREKEERRERELNERYQKQKERRESKEREKEEKELERLRKENEKFVKRMSITVTNVKKPRGDDKLVYHVSLHGSDSEPDYTEDPFQGPPYPDVSEEELGLALLTKPRSEGPSRSQSAMDMDNSLRDYSRDQSVDVGTGQDTPASAGDSDRENRSSGTSSERHRRGVLEEIDSDEFFLRQKGISEEDVEMGRLISSEIRDALRAPPGARDWSRLEYADDEDEDDELDRGVTRAKPVPSSTLPPSRPSRTRTLRPWRQGRKIPPTPPGDEPEEEEEEDEEEQEPVPPEVDPSYFNTFPPARPKRSEKSKKKAAQAVDDEPKAEFQQPSPEFEDIGPEDEAPEVQKRLNESVAIFIEDLGILAPTAPARKEPPPRPQPPKRLRKSTTSLERERERERADLAPIDVEKPQDLAPQQTQILAYNADADYIIAPEPPAEPPVPPARRRPRSRATSQADEDRTSRGADSLPSETRDTDTIDIDVIEIENDINSYQADNNGRTGASYASVWKQERPRRTRSAKALAAPGRRKRHAQQGQGRLQGWRQFFSLPRRSKTTTVTSTAAPPVRPLRNYSTLGPARPPRRNSQQSADDFFHSDLDEEERPTTPMTEPEPVVEAPVATETAKDLQTPEVPFKMKDRPLPPPPRPPRKSPRSECADQEEVEEEACQEVVLPEHLSDEVHPRRPSREEHATALAMLKDDMFSRSRETPPPEEPPVPRSPTGEELEPVLEPPYKSLRKKKRLSADIAPVETETFQQEFSPVQMVHAEPQHAPEEVSIAIQTDPLPDDLCVEESFQQDESVLSQFDQITEAVTAETESWPTVVAAEKKLAENLPSISESSFKTESKPEQEAGPPPVPPRMHVSDLDVTRLNVSELQAHRLLVSEIESAALSTSEFSAQTGTVTLASGDLPHTLAQAVADAVQSALSGVSEALSRPLELVQQQHQLQQQLQELQERQQIHQHQNEQNQQLVLQQLQTQLQQLQLPDPTPPPVPPPPLSYSIQTQTSLAEAPSPPSMPTYSIQTQTSLAESPSPPAISPPSLASEPPPPPPPRRVRTPVPAETEDSEEISPTRSPPAPRRRRLQSAHSSQAPAEDIDVTAAGRQLAVACRASVIRALTAIYSSVEPTISAVLSDGEANAKRRELQAALCLMLIVAAAMVLLGCGCLGTKVQHHHWDFHLPPPL